MRSLFLGAAAAAFIAGSAIAATAPNDNAPSNPAVKTTEGNNPGAPASGANSFTEGQAKARIEARGYANVTGLSKDDKGLWHGKAMKDGKSTNVALDYQGNVVSN
jgi:opacity protein-like surface antigen